MRKVITVILLVTILMNSIGYVGLYGLLRWHDTHHIIELIEQHDRKDYKKLILPISVCNQSDGTFIRFNKHEFRYQGKMYDIVSQKLVGTHIHFVVIQDNNDEMNFHRLSVNTRLKTQTSENTNTSKTTLLDFIIKGLMTSLFFEENYHQNTGSSQRLLYILQSSQNPKSPYLKVPVPPPKFI